MCGICAIIYLDKERPVDPEDLGKMCSMLVHRGPDEEGIHFERNAGLGMRRLSIIDLVTGSQPIMNEDGSIWIVCNGEIYNHLELRADLEKKGHVFKTRSDVESILHAYEEYGEDCSKKLNGMFAYAIWDQKKNIFIASRDHVGIKPFYYYFDYRRLICASELKAILQIRDIPKDIDFQALDHYLTFEYTPSPLTIFKKIKKLQPGHSLILKNGSLRIKNYWVIKNTSFQSNYVDMEEQIRALLKDSVKIQLMSDVPLGAFLSGGIDSSIIVALMAQEMDQPVKTFSIGFQDSTYNELEYTRIIAKRYGTEHHEFIIQPDAVDLTEELLGYLDEPLGDFSIFPTYLVSKMAREYFTVALSGDGGDELFAGYDTYIADKAAYYYQQLPERIRLSIFSRLLDSIRPSSKKKGFINRVKRFIEGMDLPQNLHHVRWMAFMSPKIKKHLYSPELKEKLSMHAEYEFILRYFKETAACGINDGLNKQLYVDLKTYLPDNILVKVDRMSMANSLEARVPYLDYRFVELASSIPGNLKLKGIQTKWILKKAMADLLPNEILTRGKEGFSIPIKNWLQNELRPMMMDILSPGKIKKEGLFNETYIERMKKEHLAGTQNHSHRLWALMVFEIWMDKYI